MESLDSAFLNLSGTESCLTGGNYVIGHGPILSGQTPTWADFGDTLGTNGDKNPKNGSVLLSQADLQNLSKWAIS